MKKACILLASPRKQGNTAALTAPFAAELEKLGWSCRTVWLYDLEVRPCRACRVCQQDWTVFGYPQEDDMQEIFDSVLACDLLVLATPIYSWYCTPPMKAVLDRLVYGMNKYYGREKGPSLWEDKPVALIATCGYPVEKGADLWEAGMQRTASTPVCGCWVCWPSGTRAMTRCSWTRKRPAWRRNLPGR